MDPAAVLGFSVSDSHRRGSDPDRVWAGPAEPAGRRPWADAAIGRDGASLLGGDAQFEGNESYLVIIIVIIASAISARSGSFT